MTELELSEFIDDILNELQFRIYEGIVDLQNPVHKSILSEILHEKGQSQLLNIITEAPEDELKDDKFIHVGGPAYVHKADFDKASGKSKEGARHYKKTKQGQYVPMSDSEYEKGKEAQGDAGGSTNNPEAKPKDGISSNDETGEAEPETGTSLQDPDYQEYIQNNADATARIENPMGNITTVGKITQPGSNLPLNIQKVFDGGGAEYRNVSAFMTDIDKQMVIEFGIDYKSLVNSKNPTDRKSYAEKMVLKYGLDTNKESHEPNPKLYMRNVSPDARKVLSGGGNKTSEELRNTIEDALGRTLYGETTPLVNVKRTLIKSSKPNISGENKKYIRTSENDLNVKAIFNKEPFNYLNKSIQQIMGPLGEDGELLFPSGLHSKEYLVHSVSENYALKNTIHELRKLEDTSNVKPQIRHSLEIHQNRMNEIVKTMKIPSKEASEAVGSSYAQMAVTLTTESDYMANSIMKNMAEMALYDTEIAAGIETYLLSAPNFPSGDTIKIYRNGEGKIEKISAVSVKYGKKGKFKSYGFPGETGQYQKFHPNVEYRDRLHSRPGNDGYDLGVNDSIVDSAIQVKQIITESGLEEAFNDTDGLVSIFQEMRTEIQKLKEDIGYIENNDTRKQQNKPVAKKQIGAHKEKIYEIEKKLASKMKQYVNEEALVRLVGKDNAKIMLKRPQVMLCALTFASTLQTSNGLDVIEHNHQEIVDGKFINHTDTAMTGQTQHLKNWHLTWRAYDDRAGGLIAGANPERINMN